MKYKTSFISLWETLTTLKTRQIKHVPAFIAAYTHINMGIFVLKKKLKEKSIYIILDIKKNQEEKFLIFF